MATWKKLALADDVHSVPAGGNAGQVLTKDTAADYDASWKDPAVGSLGVTIDGVGQVITTGIKNPEGLVLPFACTITGWYLTGAPQGSIVIDVWKKAGAIPTDSDSITGSELPTLSNALSNSDTNLTTWSVNVAVGDIIIFNVDSVSTITRATLVLKVVKS